MRRRLWAAMGVSAVILAGAGYAAAATSSNSCKVPTANSDGSVTSTCSVAVTVPASMLPTVTKTVTRTATVTASPSAAPTSSAPSTSATPTDSPMSSTPTSPPSTSPSSTSPSSGYSCTDGLGGGCGAYDDADIPMSNGYDTYVSNQDVGAQTGTTETVNANSPSDWDVVADAQPYGYTGVQTFPDVQQLMNDWDGTGWGAGSKDTPLDSLSTLKVNYAETSPQDDNSIYEYAPDVWSDNYDSDVMFWVDTHGRCNSGAFGDTVLGNAVLDGQNWTVHRYGGPGAEIIFVLDGPGGSGTCAQQSSGTVDIKAGFDWLTANGFVTGPEVISQLNTGWEITSADKTTFTVTNYSITAGVA